MKTNAAGAAALLPPPPLPHPRLPPVPPPSARCWLRDVVRGGGLP